MVTMRFVEPPEQIAFVPLNTALVGLGFTVTVAVPFIAWAGHPFASVTDTRLYVVVAAGPTDIALPLA
jgi:hypothetical protein